MKSWLDDVEEEGKEWEALNIARDMEEAKIIPT